MNERWMILVVSVVLGASAMGCGGDDGVADAGRTDSGTPTDGAVDGATPADGGALPANTAMAIETYADIVLATYDDTIAAAMALDVALDAFAADPSEANLTAAKQAWLTARESYGQSEVTRFYDGPIDNPTDGPEGSINAWPMDESFVDYVAGMADSGLVNDTSVTLDTATLDGLNGMGGADENVATGWHPIEFLLWGQDLSDTGPGARPATDFADGGTADNQDRRRLYLTTISELLITQLTAVRDQWVDDASNYRTSFVAASQRDTLRDIFAGMVILSGFELGGQRLQTALDTSDQEDEHSCFSDNTHRDVYLNALGVQNAYMGRYLRSDGSMVMGTSLYDVVAALDEPLANRLRDEMATTMTAAQVLTVSAETGETFDRLIRAGNVEGNAQVQAVVDALLTQEETMTDDVFPLLGISVEIPTE